MDAITKLQIASTKMWNVIIAIHGSSGCNMSEARSDNADRRSKSAFKGTNQVKETEIESQEYNLFNFPGGNLPFRIELSINKAMLTMEVDTGATLSLINHKTKQSSLAI